MKAYTDIEQSKKLAEILPIESADMHWQYIEEDNGQLQWFCFSKDFSINQHNTILAWSLSALLAIIPYPTLGKHADETWSCASWVEKVNPYFVEGCDTTIDACYEMVLKLNEQKLL